MRALASLAWLAGLTAVFVVPVWVGSADFFSNTGAVRRAVLERPVHATSSATWSSRSASSSSPASGRSGTSASPRPRSKRAVDRPGARRGRAGGLFLSMRRRQFGLALYVAVALIGCGIVYFSGGTPWVTGKALAISSPALLAAALTGGGDAVEPASRNRAAGIAGARHRGARRRRAVVQRAGLPRRDARAAPTARRAAAHRRARRRQGTDVRQRVRSLCRPALPARRRSGRAGRVPHGTLPLRDGAILTKSAWADLDSFPLSTLEPYRSIVTRRSPVESRPPSIYRLVWQGRYYQLWQRPVQPSDEHPRARAPRRIEHAALLRRRRRTGRLQPLCSINPVATPPCAQIQGLARQALAEHAELVAYQRPAPIVARGDQIVWPGGWIHELEEHTLTPTTPGQAVGHIAVASAQSYELWLGGSFARGFEVSVDGRRVGKVKDELSSFSGYVHVADVFLAPGVHTFALTYPHADLTPGSGQGEFTSLAAIALQPQSPASELISVPPRQAARLCGRPLDWIELVTGA